jgi:integrase
VPSRLSSLHRGERVVRRRLADGTVKEYRYPAYRRAPTYQPGSVAAMLEAYRRSPDFAAKAPATRQQYAIYLRHLEPLGDMPATALTRRAILALRDAIATRSGNGAATAFARCVSAMLAWAVDREIIPYNPAQRVKPLPGGELRAWREDEIAHALNHLPERFRRVVLLALYTGQRRGDLVRLTWNAVSGDRIRLRQAKTGAALVIPLHPALAAEMARWRAEATAATVLTNALGRPWTAPHLSREMKRALEAIGLRGISVHGLRKAAASRLAEAGCTAHEIAAITGHATLAMVAHYTRAADQERLAEAAIVRLSKRNLQTYKHRRKS